MNWTHLTASLAIGTSPFVAWIIGTEIIGRIRFRRLRTKTLRELDRELDTLRRRANYTRKCPSSS